MSRKHHKLDALVVALPQGDGLMSQGQWVPVGRSARPVRRPRDREFESMVGSEGFSR